MRALAAFGLMVTGGVLVITGAAVLNDGTTHSLADISIHDLLAFSWLAVGLLCIAATLCIVGEM